jgi:hypothetical protein
MLLRARDRPDAVASVTVAPDSATLRAVGDSVRFRATAWTAAGDIVGDVTFAWASGDTSVARVSATGLVTAIGEGSAMIIATAPGGAADSASVVVLAGSVAGSPWGVSLNGVGSTATLSAQYLDLQGRPVSGSPPLFDGTRWDNSPAPTLSIFWSLWGTSAANAYAVFMGSLCRWDGSSWNSMATIPCPSGGAAVLRH